MLNDTIFIGDVKVLPSRRLIVKNEGEELVDPLVMKLLLALAERRGGVVSREELIDEVWGEAYASDTHLSRVVWGLRRALGDRADKPAYIETVPRVGYRIIPEVRIEPTEKHSLNGAGEGTVEASESIMSGAAPTAPGSDLQSLVKTNTELKLKLRWMQRTVAVLAVVAVGLVILLWQSQPTVMERDIEVVKVASEDGSVDSLTYEGSDPFALK